jgi:AcrR family transcriptional regulator
VDQIAAAAGMSKRTFFRYFASKDDLVIGKYDLLGDRMADALDARPADQPVWQSLRRVFDVATDYVDDPRLRARNDAMDQIVRSTPQLNARYLGPGAARRPRRCTPHRHRNRPCRPPASGHRRRRFRLHAGRPHRLPRL